MTAKVQDTNDTSPGNAPTVLVVDDTPLFLNLTRRILERADYAVRTAPSAREGIAEARRSRPDLIILDVEMPEMDGLAACAALPVLILTATAGRKLNERAFKAGAAASIVKGSSADSIVNVVRLALAAGRARGGGEEA